MNQFQTWLDVEGNIYMTGGSLIDISVSPTARFTLIPDGYNKALTNEKTFVSRIAAREVTQNDPPVFLGGSGRNLILSGTLSGSNSPIGYFYQESLHGWTNRYGQSITHNVSLDTAILYDDTGTIATMTGATSSEAPFGTFTSTTYGETTYNGGTPFTLALAYEGRYVFPSLLVEVTAGTALAGIYTSNQWGIYQNGSWRIDTFEPLTYCPVIDDGTNIIAINSSPLPSSFTINDPTGAYNATTYGKTTYNSGQDFTMSCSLVPIPAPIAGYLYVTVTLSAGVVTGLTGPFFASSMPANTATAKSIPVAYSDGTTCISIQQGPILWK